MSLTFSASKLKSYSLCPQLFFWTYELGLIQRPSSAMALGTRYHAMLRQFYNNEPIEWLSEEPTKDAVLKSLLEKNRLYPITGQIVDTEYRFEIILNDLIIRGVFDRLDTDRTIEYKTTSKDYTSEDVDNFQTDIYILARYMLMWELLPMDYHVNNKIKAKTKKYKPQVIRVVRELEDLDWMKKKIVETIHKILNKEFKPTPWPVCLYCPFGSSPYLGTGNCKEYEKQGNNKKN